MKKFLSAVLALALCLSLAVPAFAAAGTSELDIPENASLFVDWGNGPSLTANEVVRWGGVGTSSGVGRFYDVVPGGGFTLDMPFPTANRRYTIDIFGTYMPNSGKDGTWGSFTGRTTYTQNDGRTSYKFAATADMAGDGKLISVSVTWADYDGSKVLQSGEASFYLEVISTPVFTDVTAALRITPSL